MRLARYRTRRKPRSPRYPSLLLPFDEADNWSRTAPPVPSRADLAANQDVLDWVAEAAGTAAPCFAEVERAPQPDLQLDSSAKVIEFPRSAAIPIFHASSLADPIFDRPRIVEAPEVVPPPPALGGILIEPVQAQHAERRPPADCLFQTASVSRRLLANAVDGLVLIAALGAFAAVFLRFNPVRGPAPLLAGVTGAMAVLLWMVYQFLFVVFTGTTPGLLAGRLTIAKFDGSPVNRKIRRWRVLAAFLSAFSAGLGYFWCFLDQDSLCWHDRITRTYLRARAAGE